MDSDKLKELDKRLWRVEQVIAGLHDLLNVITYDSRTGSIKLRQPDGAIVTLIPGCRPTTCEEAPDA